jgi:hypothetical protein
LVSRGVFRLEIIIRWGNGDEERMAANVREVVSLSPDVIKGGNLPTLAKLTTTIPIAFVFLGDGIALRRKLGAARRQYKRLHQRRAGPGQAAAGLNPLSFPSWYVLENDFRQDGTMYVPGPDLGDPGS